MASSLSSPVSGVSLASTALSPVSARPAIIEELSQYVIPDLANIITNYAVQGEAFMAADWKKFYGVEVEDLELGPEFYEWWSKPDAEDPTRLNCDTHLMPILCPETVLETAPSSLRHRFASYVDRTDYSLETLGRLVRNPKEGHPSQFEHNTLALHQNRKIKAGPACYIVARKSSFAGGLRPDDQRKYMNQVNAKTNAGYEVLPRALHLATAAFVNYTVTGGCFFNDISWLKGLPSYGRCEETVQYNDRQYPVIVGAQTPGGLNVYDSRGSTTIGICVVGVKKFPGHQI